MVIKSSYDQKEKIISLLCDEYGEDNVNQHRTAINRTLMYGDRQLKILKDHGIEGISIDLCTKTLALMKAQNLI